MVSINFAVPLKLTRSYLYIVTILTFSILVLLPWSLVAYLKFYSLLIPPETHHSHSPRVNYIHNKPFVVLDGDSVLRSIGHTPTDTVVGSTRHYDVDFGFKIEYNSLQWKRFDTVNYKVFIVNNDVFGLKLVPKLLNFYNTHVTGGKEWDLSWDLKIDEPLVQLDSVSVPSPVPAAVPHTGQVQYFQYGQLYIRGDAAHADTTTSLQWLLTLPFRLLIGSSNHDWNTTPSSHVVRVLDRDDLDVLQGSKIVMEFNSKNAHVYDVGATVIPVLTNLRFVVYHYYYASLIVGVLVFWGVSFVVSFVVGVGLLQLFKSPSNPSIKIKQEVKQEQDDSILANLEDLTT